MNIDSKKLLQVAVLGLLETEKMPVHDVLALTKKTVEDIWVGLIQEETSHG